MIANYLLNRIILLLVVVGMTSCKGQINPEQATIDGNKTVAKPKEIDPFFLENKAINPPYGPTKITRNIIQDSKGNIWLATFEGIIRYDGQSFINFTNKEKLRPFRVFSVLEDRKGNIWFGTIGAGLYMYDGITFTNLTIQEGLIHDEIGGMYEDRQGNIWIGTTKGISRLDVSEGITDISKITYTNLTMPDESDNSDVNAIIEDDNGRFWIGTRGYAYFYDEEQFTKIENEEGLPFVNVRTLIKDKSGTIWLGGNNGLWKHNGQSFTQRTKVFVGHIYEDRQGHIWTSSQSEGNREVWELSKYEKQPSNSAPEMARVIFQRADMFFGILEDTKGNIWLGSLNGVLRFDALPEGGVGPGSSYTNFASKDTLH